MPVMDGYETTRRLREDPRHRNLPIIAITANVMASDRERTHAAGMNAHIAKPINVPELYEALSTWMKPPQTAPTAAAGEAAAAAVAAMPPELPGIDTAVGLAHTGKLPLYLRMLAKFRDSQGRTFASEFHQARTTGDWPLATRLAHSLKSVARTLGASDLGQAASALEEACKNQDATLVDARLPALLHELERVVASLDALA